MVIRRLVIMIGIIGTCWGQEARPVQVNPCRTVLIQQAHKEGLRSLKFRQLPQYYLQMYHCKQSYPHLELGKRIEEKQLDRDYRSAQHMQGFSSSCAYLAVICVGYFFISQGIRGR